ncbi:MAG: hypothetical protein ACOYD4_05360 [Solirubrobacterales bacterium]
MIERAKALIEKGLKANAEERKRLGRWLEDLDSSAPQPKRTGRRRRGRLAKPPRQKVPHGTRRKQVLAELKKSPGTAPELAKRTRMASTGIYPVLKTLLREEEVAKDGTEYHLVEKGAKGDSVNPGKSTAKGSSTGKRKARRAKR